MSMRQQDSNIIKPNLLGNNILTSKKKIPFQIFVIPYIVLNFDKKLFD